MKRSSEQVKNDNEAIVGAAKDDLSSSKKHKKDDDALLQFQPQTELMPLIPAVPPEGPLTATEEKKLRIRYRFKKNDVPPKVYGKNDKKLWPELAVSVFKTQVDLHTPKEASDYMRGWFKEHEGLRVPPPKPPRSAYSIYFVERKVNWSGKFHNSRDGKKIGQDWKNLEEEEQQVYHQKYDRVKAQYETNMEFWNQEAEQWGLKKRAKLVSGQVVENAAEMLARQYGVAADDFYFFKWWQTSNNQSSSIVSI